MTNTERVAQLLYGHATDITLAQLCAIYANWRFGTTKYNVASLVLSTRLAALTGTKPYTQLVLSHWLKLTEEQRMDLMAASILIALGEEAT